VTFIMSHILQQAMRWLNGMHHAAMPANPMPAGCVPVGTRRRPLARHTRCRG
jgi:hypothetical protein